MSADIRLKTGRLEVGGKVYTLRCNMNVLADVQEEYGGSLTAALASDRHLKRALSFASAMLNDWADEQGWEERWTAKTLGRALPTDAPGIWADQVMDLVFAALQPPEEADAGEDPEKKELTSRQTTA